MLRRTAEAGGDGTAVSGDNWAYVCCRNGELLKIVEPAEWLSRQAPDLNPRGSRECLG